MNPIHYQILPADPRAHVFEVRCSVQDPDPDGQRFRLPSWIPGSYLIRDFARQFVHVRAESNGSPIALTKEAKDVWRAAPTLAPISVIARVYAFDVSVRTAYLDLHRAYFNGPSVFLAVQGREAEACTLEILAPQTQEFQTWRVATTLTSDGAPSHGFGSYRATSYDELIDHPVEMSDFALATFSAGGVCHEIALTGSPSTDLERLARDLARVCQSHIDLFGGEPRSKPPFDRYLFQITAVGEGYGGLEHRSSTSVLCRRDELPLPGKTGINDRYLNLLGLASHEYFHAWNVKRIKPLAFAPYDLASENYTRQLWAFEGITSYYDDLALVRCGLIDEARYLELVGRAITNVLRTPGRLVQSIADSSFDAWIKFYRQDENSPNAVISYYAKGSLVALALDLTLRSTGTRSLDDVMRELWKRYGSGDIGVPEHGIEAIVRQVSGGKVNDFFERYVYGTEDVPLEQLLNGFGVEWHLRAATSSRDRGGKATGGGDSRYSSWLGIKAADDLKLQHVFTGGPAERAGLAPNDVLIAFDGMRASSSSLESLLTDRSPGEIITIHAFRRDELIEVRVSLAPPPLDTCYLTLKQDAPQAARSLRAKWLGG